MYIVVIEDMPARLYKNEGLCIAAPYGKVTVFKDEREAKRAIRYTKKMAPNREMYLKKLEEPIDTTESA